MQHQTMEELTIVLFTVFARMQAREPVCSSFHYEEKLLEKMIRTEIKVENTLDKMRNIESNVHEHIGASSDQIQNIQTRWADFKTDIENMNAVVMAKSNKALEELAKKGKPMDGKIAFHAHTLPTTNYNNGDIFRFTTVLFNHGNAYNSSTGKFTAPVAGMYMVSTFLCTGTGSSSFIHFAIMHNEEKLSFGSVRDNDCISPSFPVEMSKGDTIWVEATSSSNFRQDGYRRNSFYGILLK